jgi:predicted PhzF superfamily epimerase YddE/YHI9
MSAAVKKSGSAGSLKGLTRVGLGVEDVPGGLRDEGLTDDEVRQIARDRLSGSVQLLSPTGALHLSGTPTLGLEIAPAESEQGPFAYTVSLELVQGVSVKRIREEDAKRVKAPTWRAQSVLPAGDLASLREAIGAVADAFAEDLSE